MKEGVLIVGNHEDVLVEKIRFAMLLEQVLQAVMGQVFYLGGDIDHLAVLLREWPPVVMEKMDHFMGFAHPGGRIQREEPELLVGRGTGYGIFKNLTYYRNGHGFGW